MTEVANTLVEQLYEEYQEARKELLSTRAAWVAVILLNYKFQAGDIIRSTGGQLALVDRVWVDDWDRVNWSALVLKRDGTPGKIQAPSWRHDWREATLHKRQP